MDQLGQILMMMGRVFMETFTSPLFLLIYLFLFFIVSWQYKRMEDVSTRLLGIRSKRYLHSALISTLLGLLGGLLGSLVVVFVGIDLNNIGITQLWIIALGLMFINPRFLCFAYAGGVLSLFSLLFGYPEINIPHLLGLIAVLHIVESILILLNGHFLPVPLYIKKQEYLQGAFNLQKFWPIPLIALVSTAYMDPGTGVSMPDWWPLLKSYTGLHQSQNYSLLPVVAILGYGEISTTSTPRLRSRYSAKNLALFSISLLIISVWASHSPALIPVAALFSPLGHEFVIWLGIREESNKKALYIKPSRGVMVLDVVSGSPAQKAGILSQDIIMSVNGQAVDQAYNLNAFLSAVGKSRIEIRRDNEEQFLNLHIKPGQQAGIIPVPEPLSGSYLQLNKDGIFDLARRLWRKIKK
ncbi:MAG: PDZ domain-containing protein [Syntrophomonas sp.]